MNTDITKPTPGQAAWLAYEAKHAEADELDEAHGFMPADNWYWEQATDDERAAWEAAAQAAIGACPREHGIHTDEELAAIVAAAKHYYHDNRPRGYNWGSVPDHQAARLIIGALRAMQQRERAPAGGLT